MHYNQWTLEYNPCRRTAPIAVNANAMASFKARSSFHPPPALVIDTETAHDIFGHLNPEALAYL